ncbi:GGDEF domain-containing protein [Paenibacillus caui]|uniref:GGDEF domain-containing protein n=1 Tax=Paenibacillus caui TaxID=2873927 RepID=UPI001CA9AD70|nr:GGDEF domain-containing protein [Paenibacillus caui]
MEKEDLKSLQQQVALLRAEGKYKETIEAGYYLLKCGTECDDPKSILTAHLNIAASYYCIGDMEVAFHSIDAYDQVCSKYGDDTDHLSLYNILFVLYEYNQDFSKARETLEQSIKLGEQLKQHKIVSNAYSNYSHLCLAEGKYDDALEMAKLALEQANLHTPETESPIIKIRVQLNMALAYIELGNFDTSQSLIDDMINHPVLDSFVREKSQCYLVQGNWYAKQHMYREAFEALTYAKELVESYNDIYLLKTIQEERCGLCEQMNDIPLGYHVQKEYISLLHEINKQQLGLTALKLNVKHNVTVLENKANTDYLTGLYNRDYLEKTTNEWLKQASERNESIVCITFDIDNFKTINDRYGHLFGDEVIKQVGKASSSLMAENELIGRYGGDEFVVVLKGGTLASGKKKAEQIKRR